MCALFFLKRMERLVSKFTWWVKDEKKRQHLNHFLGFAIVGVFMTFVSVLLYYISFDILHLPLKVTYITINAVMIFISYMLNNFLVFKQDFAFKKIILYYAVYLSGSFMGVGLLHLMEKHEVDRLSVLFVQNMLDMFHTGLVSPSGNTILSVITIPVIMVWNFILSSLVLKSKHLS